MEETYGIFMYGTPTEQYGNSDGGLTLQSLKRLSIVAFSTVEEARQYITDNRLNSVIILRIY